MPKGRYDHKHFEAKAHLGDIEKFKERLAYGLEAQDKVKESLENEGLITLESDEPKPMYTKIDHPKPDLIFDNVMVEVRRQDIKWGTVLLGYTKKADGWFYWSEKLQKALVFCILSKDMKKLAWVNLSLHKKGMYTKVNNAGDTDYVLSKEAFIISDYDTGIKRLVQVIQNLKYSP